MLKVLNCEVLTSSFGILRQKAFIPCLYNTTRVNSYLKPVPVSVFSRGGNLKEDRSKVRVFQEICSTSGGTTSRNYSTLRPISFNSRGWNSPRDLFKMHQTKIGQFFKKSTTASPTSSPVKKLVDKPPKVSKVDEDDDEEDKEVETTKATVTKKGAKNAGTTNGRKRKSKNSSEEEDDEDVDIPRSNSKSSAKSSSRSSSSKKPRRRIVVQDSSSEESEAEVKTGKGKGAKSKGTEVKEEASASEKEVGDEDVEMKSESEEEEPMKKNTKGKSKSKSDDDEEEEEENSPKSKKATGKDKKYADSKKKSESPKEKAKGKVKSEAPKAKAAAKSSPKGSKKKTSPSPKEEVKSKKEEVKESPKKEKAEESPKKEDKGSKGKGPLNIMGAGASPKGWNPEYDPTKAKYDPIEDASWKRGERVPYLALAKTLEAIEATSSRLRFIEILANYLRSVIVLSPGDLLFSIYLCLNKLAPAYEGVELGVAETNIMKAIAQATGRAFDKIKADAGTLGDLGLVAESSRSSQKTLFQPQPLTVAGVFQKLKEVAAMSGQASHGKKISMITSMLVACKYSEARYLTRSLLGKLRIGLAEQSLLQALAQATYLTPPDQDMSEWPPKILHAGKKMSAETLKTKIEEHAYILKSCYCECPNYDILVKAVLEAGIDGISERCKLTPGVPPRPMLAQPTKGVADVLERFEGIRFTCEYKYDGERAQIHLSEDGTFNVYSRNQENNTSKYPDIISRFSACIKGEVKSCILDSEAVAFDLEQKCILPFQVLSTRKRKDANEAEIKVQVCVFAFDILYLNGVSLVKEPLSKRREILRENFQEVPGQFLFATSLDTDSMEEVQEFLEESIKGNCEGLMVKTLDEKASYELAKRSQKWLKLKKDYLDSGGDSLDLVVIGGFLGKGKRTGTYGGFLLACYDPDEEVFQTICKLGTGFSDEQLQTHSESLKPNVIPSPKPYYRFNSQLTPDHWFDATQVWEVKCADLSLSPVHTAAEGIADPQRGVSLRFPRFLRIRDDKNIEDATSSQQVSDMYKNQEQVKNTNGKSKAVDDEDEFY